VDTLLSKEVYEYLADVRYQLRRFQKFSEEAARSQGLTAQQHQLILAIQGFPKRSVVTTTELAERLQITHHACVGLIDRCAEGGLVTRENNPEDGRSVLIRVTSKGLKILEKLSEAHLEEIEKIQLFRQAKQH
jgi:DNA-binding MarR family transcriptional regulator